MSDKKIMMTGKSSVIISICSQVVEDATSEELAAVVRGTEEELLPCPICFKTCSSRLELDAHMDTHPDTALRYTHTHHSDSHNPLLLSLDLLNYMNHRVDTLTQFIQQVKPNEHDQFSLIIRH